MKKTAALLMLSSIAYSKDFNIKFKSDAEYIVNSNIFIVQLILKYLVRIISMDIFLKVGRQVKNLHFMMMIVLIDMDTVRINDGKKR